MAPEEARKKASERRVPEERSPRDRYPQKRGANQITPQQGPEQKKRKYPSASAGSAAIRARTSYAEAASSMKVAILPKEPQASLSADELAALEEAIVEEMLLGSSCKLKFAGIHFRPGMLVVDAVDQQSADWLVEKAPHLSKWSGVELRACVGEDIPKAHIVTIFFPRSKDMEEEQLLRLVSAQNEGIHTNLWRVLSSKLEGPGRLTSISIDEESLEKILENGSTIFFRFGKIPVHGTKRKPEGNNTERESSPNSPIPGPSSEVTEMEQEAEAGDEEPDIAALSLESDLREEEEDKLLEGKGENVLPQPQPPQ